MDREYVVAHNLVERYLRGELDEQTREAFELYFLECPETLRELQLSDALRQGMREVINAEEEASPEPSARQTHRAPWPLAMAAGLAFLLVIPVSILISWQGYFSNGPNSYELLEINALRAGTPAVHRVTYNPEPRAEVALRVGMPDVNSAGKEYLFTIEKISESGLELVESFYDTAGVDGYAGKAVGFEKMPVGSYRLQVIAADGTVKDIHFIDVE